MLLDTQIYAPQDGGISSIKRFFVMLSHAYLRNIYELQNIYTIYTGWPKKVLPFDKTSNSRLSF